MFEIVPYLVSLLLIIISLTNLFFFNCSYSVLVDIMLNVLKEQNCNFIITIV